MDSHSEDETQHEQQEGFLTPSHQHVDLTGTGESSEIIDTISFSSGLSDGASDSQKFQEYLDKQDKSRPESAIDRVPREAQTEVQKAFDGTRELLSKASSQIEDYSGLNYMGPDAVVEHPYNMDALVMLNDMSVVRNACINALATNAVRLGYRIKKNSPDEGEKDSDEVAEQIIDWLEKCADEDDSSFLDLLYKIKVDEESCGNGYMEVTRDQEGNIAGFHYVPGRTIWIKRDRSGFVQRIAGQTQGFYNFGDVWEVQDNGKLVLREDRDPTITELIHFKLHNPNSNYYGIPRDISAITTMYGDELARNYNTKFFTHSATPDLLLVFSVAKAPTASRGAQQQQTRVSIPENVKREIEDHFRRNLSTATFNPGIFHLPPGVELKIEKLSTEQKDAGWMNYRKSNREEVQIAWQTPGIVIANTADGSNYATAMQEKSLYLESMVQPEQVRYQSRIMSKFWPELTRVKAPDTPDEIDETGDPTRPAPITVAPINGTGVNRHIWSLEFTRMTIADAATLAQIHNIYGTLGAIFINEIRADIGKKPIVGGDKPPVVGPAAAAQAGIQNAALSGLASGHPLEDADPGRAQAGPSIPHNSDIRNLGGRPGGGRGANGNVSVPMPRRVGESGVPQAANFGTAGQPIHKQDEVNPEDFEVLSKAAYDKLHQELHDLREEKAEREERELDLDATPPENE